MEKRAVVTIDWLRKGRMVEDLTILRNLISDSSAWKVNTKRDTKEFESTFGLQPIPKKASTESVLRRTLGYDHVPEVRVPLMPVGKTTRSQVSSLLPRNLTKDEISALSYVFSRFVLEDLPKDIEWPLVPQGLDPLSAALFTINYVSRLTGEETRWLVSLWRSNIVEHQIKNLNKIHELLLTIDDVEDVIEEIRGIQSATKKLLVPDTSIDMRNVQDSLSETMGEWVKTLDEKKSSPKSEVVDIRQQLASKVAKEIADRRKTDLDPVSLTTWNIHALRPDGPMAAEHEHMLKMFRSDLNILRYDVIVRMCEYLAATEQPGRPTAAEVEKVIGTKRRMSHYTLQKLGMVLSERYIPSIGTMGLNYRFIFTQKQKEGVLSDGLLERMVLSESEFEGCTIHLEPRGSSVAQERLPSEAYQMTANSEIISLRLDLFNRDSKSWLHGPWDKDLKVKQRTRGWLKREVHPRKRVSHPTIRELDLFGPLMSFRGLRGSRMWFLREMGYPERTARRYLHRMLDNKILRLLYTPTLEFCGLPEGMIVGGKFKDSQTRQSFIEWMTARLPFVHVYTDDSKHLVARIRLPLFSTDIVGGRILEENSLAKQLFTARLRSYKTYQMTVFHRIYNKNEFVNPWQR
ncbi:MAG: hypothetical protein ACFFE1_01935 [Candidatus Thorarchaeota archaeon]